MASSKNVKGITIELDANTTKLSNSLKDINSVVISAQSEIKKLNSLLKLDPTNTTLLEQKQRLLADAIKGTTEKLDILNKKKQEADADPNTDRNTKQYRELERQIVATEQQLGKLRKEEAAVDKALDENTKNVKEFDNAEKNASKQTNTFGDVLKANLASAIIQKAVSVLADTIKKLANEFVSLMKTGVQFNAQMEQYKVAFTTLTGSAEKADSILQQIRKDAATTPFDVKGLTEANQLLISTGLDSEKSRETILALGDAISATGGGNDELSRMAVNLQQIKNVGKASALDIKQFAYAGIDVYGLLADSMGVTREEASKMDVSFEDLSNALVKASSQGGKYFKAMENQSKTLNGQVSNLQDNFQSFAGVLAEDTTNAISGQLLPAVNDLLQSMTTGMQEEGIEGLTTAFTDGLVNIVNVVVEMLPQFVEMGTKIISGLASGLTNNSSQIMSAITQALILLIDTVIKMLPDILKLGMSLLIELCKGIAQALPELLPTIVEVLLELVDIIIDNLPMIIDAGVDILLALVDGLVEAIPMLLDALPDIIVKIVTKLLEPEMLAKLVSAGIKLIIALGEGLIKAIPQLLLMVPEVITKLSKNMKETIQKTDWLQLGKNILKGMLDGMLDFGKVVEDTIKKVGKKITKAIKDFFGIKSPSRLMKKEVGKYLAEGIAVGFEDEMPNTISDVQNAMKQLNNGIQASVNPVINPQANNNPLIIQIENFNNDRETDIQSLAEELEFYRKQSSLANGGN